MKKRGVHKGKARPIAKKVKKARATKKASKRSGKDRASARAKVRHKRITRRTAAQKAEQFVVKEEKAVKREVRFLLSPQEFHVVTFVLSLIVLAFLLSSWSIVFYSVLTIAGLLFAHFLRQHHRPHDVITIIGTFFLPLAFTLMAFRDWFSWLLLVVYSIGVISTVILYYYHKKEHSPLKIMWQVTYSKIIALTLAVILLSILPSVLLPDAFLSIFEVIFLLVMPVIFVFFFASKFFYLYFFDRKHIRHDSALSLKYSVIYTLVFVILMMCIYSIFAAGFYNSRTADYSGSLDYALIGVSNVEHTIMDLPREQASLMVMRDIEGYAGLLRDEISYEKNLADARTLSFEDIMDDSYFDVIGNNTFNRIRFAVLQQDLAILKARAVNSYDMFSAGPVERVDSYVAESRSLVDEQFRRYSQDPGIQDVLTAVNDQTTSFSYFEDQGFFYWFEGESGLDFIYHSDSIFGRQMSLVLRHVKPFRQLTQMVINIVVFLNKEAASSSAVEHIYANRDADLSSMSRAIRYGLIAEAVQLKDEKIDDANKVTFQVD